MGLQLYGTKGSGTKVTEQITRRARGLRNNHAQGARRSRDLGRSLAEVLAIGIDGEWLGSFKKNLAGAEVRHLRQAQVGPGIDAMQAAQPPGLADGRNKTEVELAVVKLRLGKHLHAAAVLGSVADG